MKYKRNKRFNNRRERVLLREDRKFLNQLESNPFTSEDDKWTYKDRRCVQRLVFELLPYLAYRLRHDSVNQLRVILLYDHYLTVLNTLRTLRKLSGVHWNSYLSHRVNRLKCEGGGGTASTLGLLSL